MDVLEDLKLADLLLGNCVFSVGSKLKDPIAVVRFGGFQSASPAMHIVTSSESVKKQMSATSGESVSDQVSATSSEHMVDSVELATSSEQMVDSVELATSSVQIVESSLSVATSEQEVESVELMSSSEQIVEFGYLLVECEIAMSSGDLIEIAAVTRSQLKQESELMMEIPVQSHCQIMIMESI